MAAPYARVVEDMVKGREYATQLQALLRDSSPEAGRLVDRILHAMSRTIDVAKTAAAAEEEASEVQSDVTCAGTAAAAGNGKRKAAGGAGDKRAACRKRTHQSSVVTKNKKDLDDGHAWRKYGQKEIQNCKYPKAYFRCTHKYDQQCLAQRQVQLRDDDPDTYTVTYIGVHTCRDPATAAVAPIVVVHAAAGADELELHAGSRLISFASGAATTSTTTTSQQAEHKDAVMLPGPIKLEAGGEQEEVLSSLTPAGSSAAAEATRNNNSNNAGATATTPSGPEPDQGDVTSGLQLQQLYGGDDDDLADMVRFGYDDTFDLDDIVFGFDHHGHPEY